MAWSTSNYVFVSGNFWDKSPSWFLKNLKFSSFYLGKFKILKNEFGQFIPNCPPKHWITSTNSPQFKLQRASRALMEFSKKGLEISILTIRDIFDISFKYLL